jgi:chemotaxis protein methyltransferase CheR
MTVSDQDIKQFIHALRSSSNYDFGDYSDKSLNRRLSKVLIDYKLNITGLITRIKSEPSFLEQVVKDITVNTTELFRDPLVWQALRYKIFPALKDQPSINVWHAGCSTGQEVYSLLILLHELGLQDKVKVYATDLNTDVLDVAKRGIYKYRFNIGYLDNFDKVMKENPFNYEELFDVPYDKYFEIDQTKDTIRMHKFLTDKPTFKKHDLVKEPNPFFIKFDIILCRNVIIYFNYTLQNKVFELFYQNLYNNGVLLLGMHESILGPFANKFQKNGQFFTRKDGFPFERSG